MMVKYDETYLVIKHFPYKLTDLEKSDFLKYFGASQVKCLPAKFKKGNTCFARFPSKELAREVLCKLHQTELFGQLLTVEYVRGSDLQLDIPSFVENSEDKEEKSDHNKFYQQFLTRLNSWTNLVDFQRPPPVHLRYSYPSPNLDILTNIIRAIYTVPKLYTQVLHLMNKMNLPCPLVDNFPIDCELYVTDTLKQNTQLSDGESEMEDEDNIVERKILPRNPFSRQKKFTVKRPKLIKPININTDNISKQTLPTSEVFEAPKKDLNPKKIELKLSSDLSSLKGSKQDEAEVVKFAPLEITQDRTSEDVIINNDETYDGTVISEEELKSNRISIKDQRMLPVFKNYHPGSPSCRLYIKNLAKNVVVNELHYIYKRYYQEKPEEQGVMYDIRLMQEGRMKGQAFVTLQGVKEAEKAVEETNGFILHGKPMVVQFARSIKPKTEDKMFLND